jgi:hypothetical protein
MAWLSVEIEVDGSTFSGWAKSNSQCDFVMGFSPALEVGGHFKVKGKSYIAESVINVANRNEELLISGKEITNAKPKARGDEPKVRGKDLERKDNSGRDH